jgi:hypothetical protein
VVLSEFTRKTNDIPSIIAAATIATLTPLEFFLDCCVFFDFGFFFDFN